jgi:hypothetical protein
VTDGATGHMNMYTVCFSDCCSMTKWKSECVSYVLCCCLIEGGHRRCGHGGSTDDAAGCRSRYTPQ